MFRITNVAQTIEKYFDTESEMLSCLQNALFDGCDMSDIRVFINGDEESLLQLGVANECRDDDLPVVEQFWDYVLR